MSAPSGSDEPASSAGRPADAAPRRVGGRYRLESVLGRGSMGTVWAATDEVLHRRVAVKEINFPPGTSSYDQAQLANRTLREARAIASLSNPYVVTLFDMLRPAEGPVIVMELLEARSLAEVLRERGRLTDGVAATIGVAVASGLLAAHAAGITHRDVKPANVLLGHDGRVKLTDFGIARSTTDQPMTATGLLLGSPAYIAPEVAAGRRAIPQSDGWGLGALLYACLHGEPPFDRGDPIATLTSVVRDPLPPAPFGARLTPVLSGLLVKDPRHRMPLPQALAVLRSVADDPSATMLRLDGGPTVWRGVPQRPVAGIDAPTAAIPAVPTHRTPTHRMPPGRRAARPTPTMMLAPVSDTPAVPGPPWSAEAAQRLRPLPTSAPTPLPGAPTDSPAPGTAPGPTPAPPATVLEVPQVPQVPAGGPPADEPATTALPRTTAPGAGAPETPSPRALSPARRWVLLLACALLAALVGFLLVRLIAG